MQEQDVWHVNVLSNSDGCNFVLLLAGDRKDQTTLGQ